MQNNLTGIVDIPLKNTEQDKLQMQSFEMALSEFIEYTSTPITIALQGEWGSGKTSLMNRVEEKICNANHSNFYSIWLNTWHYALMKSESEILVGIIQALIEQVIEITKQEHPEKFKNLIKDVYKVGKVIFKGISQVAIKTAVSQINEDAAGEINDTFFGNNENENYNLNDLRNKLSELINQSIAKNIEKGIGKKAFIFFIDDLDRIDPALAVNILELLKNIFDLDNCIFILAVDYDVVVKGLKSKFGELTDQNEREFRSFFDKIIQLPFQMPISSYVISDYLKETLLSVNIIDKSESEDDKFMENIISFTELSVGTNPRSIKRLVNTLSFINLLIKSKNKLQDKNDKPSAYKKQLIYALVCLQSGFPKIYNLLADNADIENWNNEFAQKYKIDLVSFEKENPNSTIKKKWEKILFSICNNSPYLSRHFFNIISMLKQMQLIAEENNSSLNESLPEIVDILSVTNLKTISKPKVDINNIRVLYALNTKLLPILKEKLCAPMQFIERKGRMISKLTYRFDNAKHNNTISVSVYVKQNNIYLQIGNSLTLFESDKLDDNGISNLELKGKVEVFNQIIADFSDLKEKYQELNYVKKPKNGLYIKGNKQMFEQYFHLNTQNIETFYTKKFIDNISNFMIDFMILSYKISNTNWLPK